MNQADAYEDAVDLLDADHKAVKKMFMDYDAMCEDSAKPKEKSELALRICAALKVHAQIEEEIFYPRVREAIKEDELMNEAVREHDEAKKAILQIEKMQASEKSYDQNVKQLGKLIDQHVLEEREQIFLKAKVSALDLRGMVPELFKRKQQLKKAGAKNSKVAA